MRTAQNFAALLAVFRIFSSSLRETSEFFFFAQRRRGAEKKHGGTYSQLGRIEHFGQRGSELCIVQPAALRCGTRRFVATIATSPPSLMFSHAQRTSGLSPHIPQESQPMCTKT